MSLALPEALVKRVANPYFEQEERRNSERHLCSLEATTHLVEPGQTVSWGAMVNDISVGGLNLTLCYPFRLGTFLSIDLKLSDGMVRTVMARVIHVHDRTDGMWRLGCEFLRPIDGSDLARIV
jgi:hypothetical protein